MILPHVHNNGTSRSELLEQFMNARRAIAAALEAVGAACPNDRDYYVSNDPQAGHKAREEHADRQRCLYKLIADYEILAEEVLP